MDSASGGLRVWAGQDRETKHAPTSPGTAGRQQGLCHQTGRERRAEVRAHRASAEQVHTGKEIARGGKDASLGELGCQPTCVLIGHLMARSRGAQAGWGLIKK